MRPHGLPPPTPDAARARILADQTFLADIRRGWDELVRGEGILIEDYFQRRGLRTS